MVGSGGDGKLVAGRAKVAATFDQQIEALRLVGFEREALALRALVLEAEGGDQQVVGAIFAGGKHPRVERQQK